MTKDPKCPFCLSPLWALITIRTTLSGSIGEAVPERLSLKFVTSAATPNPTRILRIYCSSNDCGFFQEMSCKKDHTTGYLVFEDYVWKNCIEALLVEGAEVPEDPEESYEFEVLIKPD